MKRSLKGHPGLRVVIGYAECLDLPEWGIEGLRVKVDTGARTSALHVSHLRLLPDGRVRFRIVLEPKKGQRSVPVETAISRNTRVRSSTGHAEDRIAVLTKIRLGPIEKEIEITLTDRPHMQYRMLLGRSALAGSFLVDPSHRYTAGRPPRRRRRPPVEE